jgi:serine/threonine protein kinase
MKRLPKQLGGLSRNPNSAKYYVDTCSPEWVTITREIKKARDFRDIDIQKSQLLQGTMKDTAVIVKIGDSHDIDNEYIASQYVKRLKGFVKFYCFFTCNDDFREFFKGKRTTICKGLGTSMKVILMPYFPMGTIATPATPWSHENISTLQSCLYIACLCYIDAYKQKQFIHNDFHAANILLKTTAQKTMTFSDDITVRLQGIRPWISDFEKSVIGTGTPIDYENFKYDMTKVFYMLPTFLPQIDRSRILNVVTFFQSVDNICSDDARRRLGSVIVENVRIM